MPKAVVKPSEDLSQPVTLGLLRSELKNELKNYPTKKELSEQFFDYNTSIAQSLEDMKTTIEDMRISFRREIRELFEDQMMQIKDVVATSEDKVVGELKAMREEMAAMNYRQAVHSDQLENHENRLTHLEHRPKLAI